jgi:hypothetical protein
MKKLFFIASAFIALSFASCKKDDNSTSTITTAQVNTTVASGTWRITYYWDTDHEETSNYSGVNFTFGSGNVLTAANTLLTLATGTWATGVDDSKVKLVLVFTTPANFLEISDDWEVTERTDTKIKLRDVSGGGGGTDYLTFEKN